MIHARKDPITGRLYELSYRPATYPDDVPLDATPGGFGPWTYDAGTQTAVPVPQVTVDAEQNVTNRMAAVAGLGDGGSDHKLLRALMLVLLDEVNLIRSKLVPALPARTAAQLRTAIQGKINAGDADS